MNQTIEEMAASRRAGRPLRVLVVAAEIFPLAKTGGLADVTSALPQALAALGMDVRLMMPGYPSVLTGLKSTGRSMPIGTLAGTSLRIVEARMPDSNLPLWIVDSPELFDRPGSPYLDELGQDWPDNPRRFAALCHAAARVALGHGNLDWTPDVVHCHDWHTGLVPMLLHFAPVARPRTVFTIHNAAFAGKFPFADLDGLDIPRDAFGIDGAEFYGGFSFLKAGIRYADKISTVSPTYAREICTPEYGCGFDGLLRARSADLVGIMNGIDAALWNPAVDPHLAQRYSRADCGGKAVCKTDLQRELGLQQDADAPLAIFVSRITSQKMADVLLHRLPEILQRRPRLQFALLGRGDRPLESGFRELERDFGGRTAVRIDYAEGLAHKLHGGGDILLHGSRFEPCGLAQLYAMRYGTVPLVRRVGGLADSVIDDTHDAEGTGFVFDEPHGDAMSRTLDRCVDAYESKPARWRRLQQNAMAADFSWTRSAGKYVNLYGALARRAA
jgi:starch synthase